ncbi:hypothetical protein V8G54_025163 [Vigna mungo]|uniref:Uncharacterized protein n=1 Tax=Vigna mungo TaxID=3915 RepID=A0AAQ3N877_VIGMU
MKVNDKSTCYTSGGYKCPVGEAAGGLLEWLESVSHDGGVSVMMIMVLEMLQQICEGLTQSGKYLTSVEIYVYTGNSQIIGGLLAKAFRPSVSYVFRRIYQGPLEPSIMTVFITKGFCPSKLSTLISLYNTPYPNPKREPALPANLPLWFPDERVVVIIVRPGTYRYVTKASIVAARCSIIAREAIRGGYRGAGDDGDDPAPTDRPILEPYGKGFVPSRVASQAITRSIKQQFLKPWPTWGAILPDDRTPFWKLSTPNFVRVIK